MKILKNLKSFLPNIDKYISKDIPVINASKKAHTGLIVPEIVMTYGKGRMKITEIETLQRLLNKIHKNSENLSKT